MAVHALTSAVTDHSPPPGNAAARPQPPAIPARPPVRNPVAAAVDERLRQVLCDEERRWRAVDPRLARPVRLLADHVLSGGKRLRPAFCLWGHRGAGGADDAAEATDAAAALELLHAFALLHDDVMDGSATRRGRPAMHRLLADEHTAAGRRGDARRHGEGVAVLVGDLAFALADRLVPCAPAEARRVWDELRIELTMGQFLDVSGTAEGGVDAETARRIAIYKSARYTVERPLHLGAALAGDLDRLAPHYSAYGVPLGEAFQLRDDLLGAFGDPGVTGKPVGDDLREGKPTLLLALARSRASGPAAALLDRTGDPGLGSAEIERIREVLVDCGARDAVEVRIHEHLAAALDALAVAPLPARVVDALEELALTATARCW